MIHHKQALVLFLDGLVEEGVFPGYQMGLIDQEDHFVFCGGYASVVPERERMRLEHRFDLASLTKVIATTSACLLLMEEGKIRPDMPISRWVPEFPSQEVKLWHLLSHSADLEADLDWRRMDKEKLLTEIFKS